MRLTAQILLIIAVIGALFAILPASVVIAGLVGLTLLTISDYRRGRRH